MADILHITNGDALTNYLKQLNFNGNIITWREMLCEGKTTTDVGSESFWRNRFAYLKSAYNITKERFVEFTLKEYRRLCNHKSEKEIVLWFDYDLFCQVNMIAVISWLKKNRGTKTISLVTSGNDNESSKMYYLTELSEEKIKAVYNNRIKLTKDDIEYADYIWQLYCGDNPMQLQNAILQNKSQLKHLTPAIQAHLQRFPTVKNGLNEIENRILQSAQEHSFTSKEEFIAYLLKNQDFYGFGDVQFSKAIDDLKPLFGSFSPVKLTKLGNSVVNKKANYYPVIRNDKEYLGGAQKYKYLFHEDTAKLLKL